MRYELVIDCETASMYCEYLIRDCERNRIVDRYEDMDEALACIRDLNSVYELESE